MTRWTDEQLDAKLANIRRWKAQEAERSAKINAGKADAATEPPASTDGRSPEPDHKAPCGADAASTGPFVVLPWPPSGNTGVRHSSNGGHYINPKVIAYRKTVAAKCAGAGRVQGRYRISVHFSPPDRRARDMDNALKTLLDALVACRWLPADSMNYMRELRATVDDHRRGLVAVEVTEE